VAVLLEEFKTFGCPCCGFDHNLVSLAFEKRRCHIDEVRLIVHM